MNTYKCPHCETLLELDNHTSDGAIKSLRRKLQSQSYVLWAALALVGILGICTLSLKIKTNKLTAENSKLNLNTENLTTKPSSNKTLVEEELPSLKIEGEDIRNVIGSSGAAQQQPMRNFGKQWSGNRQLWWTSARPEGSLIMTLSVQQGGLYRVHAQFTKAADYGIFDLYLNGKKIKESIDFYNTLVDVTGEIDLGLQNLETGDNELKAVIIGANPSAIKRYMFGLDYIQFTKPK